MCFTLVFWLFVSTPVTLKLDIDDNESITDSTSPPRSRTETTAWKIENFHNMYKTLTVQDTIGNRKWDISTYLELFFTNTYFLFNIAHDTYYIVIQISEINSKLIVIVLWFIVYTVY